MHIRIESTADEQAPLSSYGPIASLTVLPSTSSFGTRLLERSQNRKLSSLESMKNRLKNTVNSRGHAHLIGDFIRTAGEGGAAVIAFDVAFVDEDRSNVRPSVQRLRQKLLDSQLGPDGALAVLEEKLKKTLTAKERQRLLPIVDNLRASSKDFLARLDDEIRCSLSR